MSFLCAKNIDWPEPLVRPLRDALSNNQRFGYFDPARLGDMRSTVTNQHWTTDMRTIDQTDRPGGQTSTFANFMVKTGKTEAQRA